MAYSENVESLSPVTVSFKVSLLCDISMHEILSMTLPVVVLEQEMADSRLPFLCKLSFAGRKVSTGVDIVSTNVIVEVGVLAFKCLVDFVDVLHSVFSAKYVEGSKDVIGKRTSLFDLIHRLFTDWKRFRWMTKTGGSFQMSSFFAMVRCSLHLEQNHLSSSPIQKK